MNGGLTSFTKGYWTELHRPSGIEDGLILDEGMRKIFTSYIEKQEFPHLLFVGPPGTGKTTLAMALIRQICKSDIDLLHINGSVDNGVDNIRETIMAFLGTPPNRSNIKIVFIDECDFLSASAFAALRATIEQPTYNKNLKTRFIFCANYINKIPDPILSRLTTFTLNFIPKDQALHRCKQILDKEQVSYTENDIQSIVDHCYPDMRSIVKTLQASCIDGRLTYHGSYNSNFNNLLEDIDSMIKVSSFTESYTFLSRCREAITDEIDIPGIIGALLEKYVASPAIHCTIFRYQMSLNTNVSNRHTLIALLNEIVCMKFGMFI